MGKIGYLELTLTVASEGDQYSALCEELGTASYADTPEEALRELHELVLLHLEGLRTTGERERFFREHGITIHPVPPVPTERRYMLGGGRFPEIIPLAYPIERPAQFA